MGNTCYNMMAILGAKSAKVRTAFKLIRDYVKKEATKVNITNVSILMPTNNGYITYIDYTSDSRSYENDFVELLKRKKCDCTIVTCAYGGNDVYFNSDRTRMIFPQRYILLSNMENVKEEYYYALDTLLNTLNQKFEKEFQTLEEVNSYFENNDGTFLRIEELPCEDNSNFVSN